jgi:hypothetical protein
MSGSVLQSGPITFGHVAMWLANGTLMDGGPAGAGDLTQVGITNDGGLAFGVQSGPIALPYVGFGVTVSSDGTIQLIASGFNGAPNANLEYVINGITYSAITSLAESAVITVQSVAGLRALASAMAPSSVNVDGYYAIGDGGGGMFAFVPSDTTSTDDGGSIIVDTVGHRYYRQIADRVTWEQFGARGDLSADDTVAIQNAWNYSAAHGGVPAVGSARGYLTTAPLVVPSNAVILGAGSFSANAARGWEAPTYIVYHGNVAALTVTDPLWGGVTIEKVSFVGDYLTYPAAIGLFLDDSVRTIFNVCILTLRDVMFKWFATGFLIGNKYQTVIGFNVICISCSNIGAKIESADCYFTNLMCGNSGEGTHVNDASVAQLWVGDSSPLPGAAGVCRFMGGAFFSALNAVLVQNANSNKFFACDIQNASHEGVLLGDGLHACSGNTFVGCMFSGNNRAGGVGNAAGTFFCDAGVLDFAVGTKFIGCNFADISGLTTKVAGAVAAAPEALGLIVSGCTFNIDNMHNPVAMAQPFPILLGTGLSLDYVTLEGNQYTTGLSGGGLFSQKWGQEEAQNQYFANGIIALSARTACINGGFGPIFLTLPNPQFFGRKMDIILTSGVGSAVTSATAFAFNASRTVATFTAAFASLSLISISPTQWGIVSSTNVVLS